MTDAGDFEVTVGPFDSGGSLVRVRGEVDMATSSELDAALENMAAGEKVVLDLTECAFLDSSALRVLVTGATRAETSGGSLSLVAPDPRIRRVLEIAGLEERLTIHPTLEAAG